MGLLMVMIVVMMIAVHFLLEMKSKSAFVTIQNSVAKQLDTEKELQKQVVRVGWGGGQSAENVIFGAVALQHMRDRKVWGRGYLCVWAAKGVGF